MKVKDMTVEMVIDDYDFFYNETCEMVTPINRSSITSILLLITKAKPAGASVNNDQAGAPPPEVTEQKGDHIIRDLWQ